VGEIKDYLSEQRDLYMATPKGWPTVGWLSSSYGYRTHPIKGTRDFHTGVDISASPGSEIKATADGIVSFSGWSGANGRLVAIEHGHGFRTFYAHNKKIAVKVGDVVQRGDVIAYVGSTGSSTGPHVHYEVWKSGKSVNPKTYLKAGEK
jgi:murein DD-endopeptidase MepM/ murein hydrolase activator NlpD